LPLGGTKQRAVLALLLLRPNSVVSAERLIDEIWGDDPPESASNMIQGYVSRLRKVVGPDRIVSVPPGYVVRVRAGELDSERFAALAAEARRLLELGEGKAAAAAARSALAEWRGPALLAVVRAGRPVPEVARLEELRLTTIEDRVDADLARGRAGELVPELRQLNAEHPLRERLATQLMTALYRDGRQADALAVYRDTRNLLDEQLGIEPGPALRELERAILQQDPALAARTGMLHRAGGRRILLIGTAVATLTTAAVGIAAATNRSPRNARIEIVPHSVAVIDPARNAIIAGIAVGGWPGPLAADGRYVYVSNIGDGTVSRIEPRRRIQFDSSSFSRAIDLVAHNGDLWAANGGAPGHTPLGVGPGTLLHYSAGPRWQTVRVGPDVSGDEQQTTLAGDGRGATIWAGNADAQTVTEVDASLGRKLLTVRGVAPGGLAVVAERGTDIVWATDPLRNRVVRIDERERRVVARIPVPNAPTRIAADARAVWVLTRRALWRIDPTTNRLVRRIALPVVARRLTLGAGAVWVGGSNGDVLRIDQRTSEIVARIPLGGVSTDGLIFTRGLLWVAAPPAS
jgi:DNA-binding SARP family transcriptional activator